MDEHSSALIDASDRIDEAYTSVLNILREAQVANLSHAWELGALLDQALNDAPESDAGRLVRDLAARLCAAGCEISASALRGHRDIHRCFRCEDLPDLVQRGISPSHAHSLAALDDELRAAVWNDLFDAQGRAIPTRALRRLIVDCKKRLTRSNSVINAAIAEEARLDDRPLQSANTADDTPHPLTAVSQTDTATTVEAEEPREDAGRQALRPQLSVVQQPLSAPSETVDESDAEARARAHAAGPKGFTQSPIKIVKAADNVAIKLLSQSADLMLACDEVCRIGYDSERSLANFLGAAESLQASLQSYQQVLPEVLERLARATRALAIDAG